MQTATFLINLDDGTEKEVECRFANQKETESNLEATPGWLDQQYPSWTSVVITLTR